MKDFEKFDYESRPMDKPYVESRIVSAFGMPVWKFFVCQVQKRGLSFTGLKTVEVGCGTGTTSLAAAMLGAEVTLIDIDEVALRVAKEAFALYNLNAVFLKADVLQESPAELTGKFDFAFSGGLAEHFIGENRVKVMAFHRKLLKDNGFALITAPNILSAPYWTVRLLSKLFGQWPLETEIPFSYREFLSCGKKAGFKDTEAHGTAPLGRDVLVYGFAVIALLMRLLPKGLKTALKKGKLYSNVKNMEVNTTAAGPDIFDFVKKSCERDAQTLKAEDFDRPLRDRLSSGLFFFGANSKA